MGISRFQWGIALLGFGAFCGMSSSLLRTRGNMLSAYQEGRMQGAGFVATACFIAGVAFLIQHYRRRHDYDEEDEERRE